MGAAIEKIPSVRERRELLDEYELPASLALGSDGEKALMTLDISSMILLTSWLDSMNFSGQTLGLLGL